MSNKTRKINPIVIARGTDLGDGYCIVRAEWLPDATLKVARKNNLIQNGVCVVSAEFIDNPWHANAVYSLDGHRTEYSA